MNNDEAEAMERKWREWRKKYAAALKRRGGDEPRWRETTDAELERAREALERARQIFRKNNG